MIQVVSRNEPLARLHPLTPRPMPTVIRTALSAKEWFTPCARLTCWGPLGSHPTSLCPFPHLLGGMVRGSMSQGSI